MYNVEVLLLEYVQGKEYIYLYTPLHLFDCWSFQIKILKKQKHSMFQHVWLGAIYKKKQHLVGAPCHSSDL